MSVLAKKLQAPSAVTPSGNNPPFQKVALLLHGDGTNGAQDNTFVDSSTNNFTITRTGNVAQGTFSPFSLAEGQWSNYFDGTGDYLSLGGQSAFAFGTNDFTVEMWIYPQTTGAQSLYGSTPAGTDGAYLTVGTTASNTVIVYVNAATRITGSVVASANKWTHVAVSRSGTSTKLFINGVQDGSTWADTTSYLNGANRPVIGINSYTTSIQNFNGYISNVRVVNGTAVYTSNFTPSTSPLTAITNTSLLTCQSNRFKDNSSNNFTITRNGDTKVTAFSPFAPSAAYSASTNGGSGYFDGSGDWLSAASSTSLDVSSGNFTVECWLYSNTLSSDKFVVYRGATAITNGADLQWGIYTSGTTLYVRPYQSTTDYSISLGTISTGTWYHIALVRNGDTFTGYLNGIAGATTKTITGSLNNNAAWNGVNIGLGTIVGTAYATVGYITDVRVIKGTALYTSNFTPPTAPLTAISNTQLLLNCTNAGIIDNAGKNDIETVGNAQVSTSVKKYGTGSMYFDGTGDYLKIPNSSEFDVGSGNFTIEMWVYPSNATNPYALFSKRNDSGSETKWVCAYINTSGTIQTQVSTNGTTWNFNTATSSTITAATWSHLAFVRNGSDYSVYVNGVKNTISSSLSGSVYIDTNPVIIGQLGLSGAYLYTMNGYIDDLRITKGQALYTSNFTPPTAAFPDY